MTNQEAFDRALQGIRQQGGPSYDGKRCCYRGPDGTKCAVGHLIPDDAYSPKMEDHGVLTVLNMHPEVRPPFEGVSRRLLSEMQSAHDCSADGRHEFMSIWETRMQDVAYNNDLTYTPPGTIGT